jgi:hypothetical protein
MVDSPSEYHLSKKSKYEYYTPSSANVKSGAILVFPGYAFVVRTRTVLHFCSRTFSE